MPQNVAMQLQEPIDRRALFNVADHVFGLTVDQVTQVDARWAVWHEISAIQRLQENSNAAAIQQLSEMLKQLNFKLDVPTNSEARGLISKKRELLSQIPDGRITQNIIEAIYGSSQLPYNIVIGNKRYDIRIRPVIIRPNLNLIGAKALPRYLRYLGLEDKAADDLAIAILHWRGEAGIPGGAVLEGHYRLRQAPYRERRAPLRDWAEVQFLHGAGLDLVNFLRQHFVLHGDQKKMLVGTLPAEAMAALTDLPLQKIKMARDFLAESSDKRQSRTLADVIGVTDAGVFDSVFTRNAPFNVPLIITVSDGRQTIEAVFDRRTMNVLDVYSL